MVNFSNFVQKNQIKSTRKSSAKEAKDSRYVEYCEVMLFGSTERDRIAEIRMQIDVLAVAIRRVAVDEARVVFAHGRLHRDHRQHDVTGIERKMSENG